MIIYKFIKSKSEGQNAFSSFNKAMEEAFYDWYYYRARPKEIVDGQKTYNERDIFEYFYDQGWIGD